MVPDWSLDELDFVRDQSVYGVTKGNAMQHIVLNTKNNAWGFFGTIGAHANPNEAWALAFAAVSFAAQADADAVRAFLDSRYGRHFADEVVNEIVSGLTLEGAVGAAVDTWQRWTISRTHSRESGIPAGLPYLTGMVLDFEVRGEE